MLIVLVLVLGVVLGLELVIRITIFISISSNTISRLDGSWLAALAVAIAVLSAASFGCLQMCVLKFTGSHQASPMDKLQEKLPEMSDWLNANGGSADFGTFVSRFPGFKKKQLTGHFQILGKDHGFVISPLCALQIQGKKRAAETPLVGQMQCAQDTSPLLQEDMLDSPMHFKSGAKIEIKAVLSNTSPPCVIWVPGEFVRYVLGTHREKCHVKISHGNTSATIAVSDARSHASDFSPEVILEGALEQQCDELRIQKPLSETVYLTEHEKSASVSGVVLFVDKENGNGKLASNVGRVHVRQRDVCCGGLMQPHQMCRFIPVYNHFCQLSATKVRLGTLASKSQCETISQTAECVEMAVRKKMNLPENKVERYACRVMNQIRHMCSEGGDRMAAEFIEKFNKRRKH